MTQVIIHRNNMALDNNKTAIVNNWKRLWHKTRASIFGQYVEQATGDYPDFSGYTSPSNEREGTEDDMILDAIKNNQHIF